MRISFACCAAYSLGAGFLFFAGATPVTSATGSGPGSGSVLLEMGYTITPGALETAADESLLATLHFQVTSGWKLEELTVKGAEVRVGGTVLPAQLTSTVPPMPIGSDFDLVYQFVLPAAVEGEPRVARLRLEIEARAKSGGLFGNKSNSDRSVSFVIDEAAGVLR